MENVTITKAEYEALQNKSKKWDELENKISEFYCDEQGEYSEDNPKRQGDLCDIGEVASSAFGWL